MIAATREFDADPGFMNGHWYMGPTGLLYIVPDESFGLAEIHGPGDAMEDTLNAIYREVPFDQVDPRVVANDHGLDYVPEFLRRFDDISDVYYSA